MRERTLARLAAPLGAAALLTSLVAALSTSAAVADTAPDHPGARVQAEQALQQVLAARDDAAAASASAPSSSARTGMARAVPLARLRDVSGAMLQLGRNLDALPVAEQRTARSLLARPTDGPADPNGNGYSTSEATPYGTTHFCIHYVTTTVDRPNPGLTWDSNDDGTPDVSNDVNGNGVPDYVESVGTMLESSVYAKENGAAQMNWPTALSDGSAGNAAPNCNVGAYVDVYIKNLYDPVAHTGIYGYAAADWSLQTGNQVPAFLVLDNDYLGLESNGSAFKAAEVTTAHEYNHVLQYGIDWNVDTWMYEATAVWMEDEVFGAVNDYQGTFMPSWAKTSTTPLTQWLGNNTDAGLRPYGSMVWSRWLASQAGTPNVIRDAWVLAHAGGNGGFTPGAYMAGLNAQIGGSPTFGDQFSRFAAATAEWRTDASAAVWTDRAALEGTAAYRVKRQGAQLTDQETRSQPLDHTAYALYDAPAALGAGGGKLVVTATFPSGVDGSVALVGYDGTTTTTVLSRKATGGRAMSMLVNPGGWTKLTAVVTNESVRHGAFDGAANDWTWQDDGITVPVTFGWDTAAPTMAVADGAGSDIDEQASATQLQGNWSATDALSGATTFDYCFTTNAGNNCGAGTIGGLQTGTVATSATQAVAVAAATTYYVCVRGHDAAGNVGAGYTCSDGVQLDQTAPTMPTPRDGASSDADWLSGSTLVASWPAALDVSGIASYDWCFTATPGGCGSPLGGSALGSTAGLGATATGSVTAGVRYFVCVRAHDGAGNVGTYACSNGATVDATPPSVTAVTSSAFSFTMYRGRQVELSWNGTDAGSGVASYQLQYRSATWRSDFGAYVAEGPPSAGTSAVLPVAPGATYCFRVVATDVAGLTGQPSTETCTAVPYDDGAMVRGGKWATQHKAGAYMGSLRSTTTQGASLSVFNARARSVYLLAWRCPTCGSVAVYWNGKLAKRLSLQGANGAATLPVASFASAMVGKVRIVVTSSGKPVQLDGIGLRQA